MKRLVAFDLDGTLAESKQAIDPEMAGLLARLSSVAIVAVISGGDWPQFRQQLVGNLPTEIDLAKWFLMPTSGTKLYRHDGEWNPVYADLFTNDERALILAAFDAALAEAGIADERIWGERIEDRGSQITFSGLGQQAPLEAKTAWDPDFAKRKRLQAVLGAALPGFAVRTGGSTSIDITRAGIDKAFGMGKLAELSGVSFDEMIFIGDAVYPGGNDFPVREAGIDTIAVHNVHETKRAIEAIVFCLNPAT
jgi:HAD superfamily hydrolase (TIGR01484 family)